MAEQPSLFPEPEPSRAQFKNCERCGVRCRAGVPGVNATIFVYGDIKNGRWCVNCLIVDFFKNYSHGPSSGMGKEYFDPSLPQPEWRKEVGDPDKRFDLTCLREPETQERFNKILLACYADVKIEEIDWDEVIANWHLPFPERKIRKRKKEPE